MQPKATAHSSPPPLSLLGTPPTPRGRAPDALPALHQPGLRSHLASGACGSRTRKVSSGPAHPSAISSELPSPLAPQRHICPRPPSPFMLLLLSSIPSLHNTPPHCALPSPPHLPLSPSAWRRRRQRCHTYAPPLHPIPTRLSNPPPCALPSPPPFRPRLYVSQRRRRRRHTCPFLPLPLTLLSPPAPSPLRSPFSSSAPPPIALRLAEDAAALAERKSRREAQAALEEAQRCTFTPEVDGISARLAEGAPGSGLGWAGGFTSGCV